MRNVIFIVFLLLINETVLSNSYKVSDHYNGKTFHNPGQSDEVKSFWQVLKWKATSDPVEWPDHVAIKNYPFRPIAPSEKVSATFINHATFLIQFPGMNILTDPVYSERVSPYSFMGPKRVKEPGIPFDTLPKIDIVVVSHNHYDHLDIETLKQIDGKFHPLFLVPLGDEKYLKKEGIQNVKAMDWWEELKVRDIKITFAPSLHWSARHIWDKNECLWGSFMLDSGAAKVYHAGDTGYGPHFLDIKSRLGAPDLSLLPIGAYAPRWFMQSHHMDPEDAVKAHIDLGSAKSIGMHFGTFQLTDEGIDDPPQELGAALTKYKISSDKFTVLDQGQGYFY